MTAEEPRPRRRGYFLSESGGEPDFADSDSAEGFSNFRPVRPRRARKAVPAARAHRHRAALPSQHASRSKDKKAGGVKSATSTGNHRP